MKMHMTASTSVLAFILLSVIGLNQKTQAQVITNDSYVYCDLKEALPTIASSVNTKQGVECTVISEDKYVTNYSCSDNYGNKVNINVGRENSVQSTASTQSNAAPAPAGLYGCSVVFYTGYNKTGTATTLDNDLNDYAAYKSFFDNAIGSVDNRCTSSLELYVDKNWGGSSGVLNGNSWANLGTGLAYNISSHLLNPMGDFGASDAYDGENYTGTVVPTYPGVNSYSSLGYLYDNAISSIQEYGGPGTACIYYVNWNFSGSALVVYSGTNIPYMSYSHPTYNNAISSVTCTK